MAWMTITLFALDVSNFCSPIKIALNFKGVSYEVKQPPGGYGSNEYKSIVPMGTIPAIQAQNKYGNGLVTLSESSVILEYIEDAIPYPSLMLDDPAGKAAVRFVNRSCFAVKSTPSRATRPFDLPPTAARAVALHTARPHKQQSNSPVHKTPASGRFFHYRTAIRTAGPATVSHRLKPERFPHRLRSPQVTQRNDWGLSELSSPAPNVCLVPRRHGRATFHG